MGQEVQVIIDKTADFGMIAREVKDDLYMFAGKLPGDRKQGLSIARCLTIKPKILLLYEPYSVLDVKNIILLP